MSTPQESTITPEAIKNCIRVLQHLQHDPSTLVNLPESLRIELLKEAGSLARPNKYELKRRLKAKRHQKRRAVSNINRKTTSQTGIRAAREANVFIAPKRLEDRAKDVFSKLATPKPCYICDTMYDEVHHFYDALCPPCADYNYQKRFQTADLTGQVVLITGARLKIGYQATVMMLQAGATVVATTRFPVDAALRFAAEPTFGVWGQRLHIYGLDLRHTPSVELFSAHILDHYDRLDLLLNNAAQTVRRPSGFYAHLMANEQQTFSEFSENVQLVLSHFADFKNDLSQHQSIGQTAHLPLSWQNKGPGMGILSSAKLSQIPYSFDQSIVSEDIFPTGQLDADLQQVDLRDTNSWRLRLGEIETAEMLEVQLVNAIAPFVLCNRLIPLMKKENTGQKHIVNVTAMEGKFHRFKKSNRHPHTNMAKAALNMMTHTAASDLAKHGIYINAVDTGWVTDEDPVHLSVFKQKTHDFQPPLDIVDGGARICDPFFDGINTGKHWNGKFLKDYFPIDW